jgi:hypothetical protein
MPKGKRAKAKDRGYQARPVNVRQRIPRFLIVCEGEKTELNYFKGFRVPTHPRVDAVVKGTGYNTESLVRYAMEIKEEWEFKKELEIKDDGTGDQVWCVFDRDEFPARTFNAALQLAEAQDIKVAYSNQSFEFWYVLHYQDLTRWTHRDEYKPMLSKLIGREYKKNDTTMYEELQDKQQTAIRHAKKLLLRYDPPNPERDNPSTTVHKLVEELNRFLPGVGRDVNDI